MAVLPLRPRAAVPEALPPADALSHLSERQRAAALDLEALLKPAIERMAGGIAAKAAAQWLAAQADGLPSWKSIERHLNAYKKGGVAALADGRTGKQRTVRGWEARAVRLFAQPQQPSYATVAYWLRQEGFADAREDLVRSYLKKCPSNLTETAPARLGKHYYNQNIKPHVVRDSTVLDVGFVYEGDGHCCDVYAAHPATGRAFRPELTTWLDVRSHYVVSWWLSESESAQTTLFSLSQALVVHDHVPAFVHSDPGSGFIARIVSDEVSGFLKRFEIDQMEALPGNARGKGLQEGWFRWFEERCGKRFATYCGHDRTDDYLRRLGDKVKLGKIVLPTLTQYADAIRAYIEAYNHTPQKGLGNKSPADLWATLKRTPVETPAAAVVRPRERRTVRNWGISLDNRKYRAAELAMYERREVLVEYSLHDDGHVWILDLEGRFVAEAGLVEKTPWLPDSRIEEAKHRRLEGQQKRLQRAMDEAQARSVQPISTSDFLDSIAAPEAPALPAAAPALTQGHDFTPAAPKPVRKPRALDAHAHAANPYGVPLFSSCFWPYIFKHGGFRWFVKFCERFGLPFPVGKFPVGSSKETIDALEAGLENLIEAGFAAIEEGGDISLIESKGGGSGKLAQHQLIETCNAEMSKALTSQTLATEQSNGRGSQAASQTHAERHSGVNDGDRTRIAKTLNKLWALITLYNIGPDAKPPTSDFIGDDQGSFERAQVYEVFTKLGGKPSRKAMAEDLGIALADEADPDDVLDAPAPAPPPAPGLPGQPGAPADGAAAEFAKAIASAAFADQAAIDDANVDDQLQPIAKAMLGPLLDALAEGLTPEQLKAKLAVLFPQLDQDAALQGFLQRAIFVAMIWGRLNSGGAGGNA